MNALNLALTNILSPVVLCYFFGMIARLLKSDLKVPDPIYTFLTIYLLLSLGLKGGQELSHFSVGEIIVPLSATLVIALITPLCAFWLSRVFLRLTEVDSSALAAHYGSVSVVTFITAMTFLQNQQIYLEPYLTSLVVIMEVPAIILALVVGKRALARAQSLSDASASHSVSNGSASMTTVMREILTSKSILLLLGGLVIGLVSSKSAMTKVEPFFVAPFQGAGAVFLLEMGSLTAARLRDLRKTGARLLVYALVVPLCNGILGVTTGSLIGLGVGGSTILAVLSASASYIAAPAAVRLALPEASPSLYLTAALGITFPFNLAIGIPLYFQMAQYCERVLL